MAVWDDGLDHAGQLVLNAAVLRLGAGKADIACQDAQPHRPTQGQAGVAHPHSSAGKGHPRQMPGGVQLVDLPHQQCGGLSKAQCRVLSLLQQFGHWPRGLDAALLQHHQLIGQTRHFIGRVGDIKHGCAELVAQPLEPGQDLAATRHVQRCKWLIEQQDLGLQGQGSGNGHALALAARELLRLALQQAANAE